MQVSPMASHRVTFAATGDGNEFILPNLDNDVNHSNWFTSDAYKDRQMSFDTSESGSQHDSVQSAAEGLGPVNFDLIPPLTLSYALLPPTSHHPIIDEDFVSNQEDLNTPDVSEEDDINDSATSNSSLVDTNTTEHPLTAYCKEITSKIQPDSKTNTVVHSSKHQTIAQDKSRPPKGPYRCPECGILRKTKYLLSLHMKSHSEIRSLSCDECEATFKCKSSLARHKSRHTDARPFPCERCEKKFKSKPERDAHMETHEPEDGGSKTLFICDICCRSFTSRHAFLAHKRLHYSEVKYFCHECGKEFNRRQNLVVHVQCHLPPVSERCHICGKTYSRKPSLATHIRSCHTKKTYQCEECGEVFVDEKGLTLHLDRHRNRESTHKCKECGKTFLLKRQLELHLNDHKIKGKMTCLKCKEEFLSFSELFTHNRNIHQTTIHPCGTCGEMFNTAKDLRKHSRMKHPRKGSINCEHCGKIFWNDMALTVHRKTQCFS